MAARAAAMGQPVTTPAETRPAPARGAGPQRKVGPLPLWAWAAIGIGGIAAVLYWRRRNAAPAPADTSTRPDTATTTAIPVPEGTGLTGSQYADLSAQNAAIYEAIQDLQGPPSRPIEDHDADDMPQGQGRVPRQKGPHQPEPPRRRHHKKPPPRKRTA